MNCPVIAIVLTTCQNKIMLVTVRNVVFSEKSNPCP